MAMGWKMSDADIPVTFVVAVGPTLLRVCVSTNDNVVELCRVAVVNGAAEGSPEVSREVCTVCANYMSMLRVSRTIQLNEICGTDGTQSDRSMEANDQIRKILPKLFLLKCER